MKMKSAEEILKHEYGVIEDEGDKRAILKAMFKYASQFSGSEPEGKEAVELMGKIKDLIRDAWFAAANAYRLYPDNKHTFSDYWNDLGEKQLYKILKEQK